MDEIQLDDAEVHVWSASTCATESLFPSALLSGAERAKAERFRRAGDRARYIASHALLRLVLSAYAGAPPRALQFERDARDKPRLAPGAARAVNFSLAHSGDRALVAVTRDRPVGVDIEEIRADLEVAELAKSVLSPSEFRELERSSIGRRRLFLFQSWVRKEAVLKASGRGLTVEPACVAVIADAPGNNPEHLAVELDGATWGVRDVASAGGYAAAVAAQGEDWVLRCFDYAWKETIKPSPAPPVPGIRC